MQLWHNHFGHLGHDNVSMLIKGKMVEGMNCDFQVKVQMKCFFIAEFERATKIRKIAIYHFLIFLLVPDI